MPEKTDPATLLGSTACWAASVRAHESRRTDRLFEDPWAEALAGPTGAAWTDEYGDHSASLVIIRTRFFDEFLQQAAFQHGIRQIVLLGAGLDTRAYRLSWPAHTCFFELDQPHVIAAKQQILDAAGAQVACQRRTLGVDFMRPWKDTLLAAGFDLTQPTAWLVEGLLFYLSNEQIERFLETVTDLSAAASWLGFDVVNNASLTDASFQEWTALSAEMGITWFGTMDHPVEALMPRGWHATLTEPGQPDANYGRWDLPVVPLEALDLPHTWFITAQKR